MRIISHLKRTAAMAAPLILALAVLPGCPQDNDHNNGTDRTTAFLGTWVNTTGSSTITCPSMDPSVNTIPANEFQVVVSKKSNSQVTFLLDFTTETCELTADVDGTIATVMDQTCTFTQFSMKFKTATMTIAGSTASMTIDSEQSAQTRTCDADFTFGLTLKP